jgi:GNAT superfamily N-acetyltransferase
LFLQSNTPCALTSCGDVFSEIACNVFLHSVFAMSFSTETTLRRAVTADIPALLELADVLVAYDRQFDPSLDPAYNRSEEGTAWLRESLVDTNALVLIASANADAGNATPLGMLFGRLEESEPWRATGGVLAELEMLCVVPEGRGRGIGKKLVEAFAAWARERGAVRLWVRVSAENSGAVRFYQRELFRDYDVVLERRIGSPSC